MLDHIIRHSKQVCQVALCLVDQLQSAQIELNRDLVLAAALLHDITKTRSFETGENHAKSGAEMIAAMGYPEVGEIIGQHVHLIRFDPATRPNEAEVVNYADKRVLHENVVSLEKRMAYILERYGVSPDHHSRIQQLWDETLQIEAKLFDQLPIRSDQLVRFLSDLPEIDPDDR